MDYKLLAELLFPHVSKTPEEVEAEYPARQLPEGAKVTRFAPSPTGFVHFGGLFPTLVGERLAHQSGGVFYLRIEDTDAKREVAGAAESLIKTFNYYGINFDEGAILDENGNLTDCGNYGPYKQSKRVDIYHVFAKKLVAEGKAYPVFTTKEELEALNAVDKKAEVKSKDWHEDNGEQREEMLKNRNFTIDEVKAHLEAGDPFVLRMLSDGDPDKKIKFNDLIKGDRELPENDRDEVLLKSDGVPSYHFAHAIDDHLMGTTHVIRGDEWYASLSRHIMLFRYLGFKLPKYAHISPIMQMGENGSKKKFSKRDLGSNMEYYRELGYDKDCVVEYVMTLLNSNYEDWHAQNPDKKYTDFPFSLKKMSSSGCLYDINKLTDVSKNVISRMDAETVYERLLDWAQEFDTEFATLLRENEEMSKKILAIGRGGKKPRKDLAKWSDARDYMGFFFAPLFEIKEEYPENFKTHDIKTSLELFKAGYDYSDDMNTWFEKIKEIATKIGFAADMKEFKANPEAFGGNVADVSMFIRVAVTGKTNAPDLYTVMQIIGYDETIARIDAMLAKF